MSTDEAYWPQQEWPWWWVYVSKVKVYKVWSCRYTDILYILLMLMLMLKLQKLTSRLDTTAFQADSQVGPRAVPSQGSLATPNLLLTCIIRTDNYIIRAALKVNKSRIPSKENIIKGNWNVWIQHPWASLVLLYSSSSRRVEKSSFTAYCKEFA